MGEWSPKEDSPAARIDEEDYLRRCAENLRKCEPPKRTPVPGANYVTDKEFGRTLEAIGKLVGKAIREATDRLAARIAELEAERTLKYVGPWKLGGDYKPGEFVSYGGGIWHCKQRTGVRPNSSPACWQLAVKSAK